MKNLSKVNKVDDGQSGQQLKENGNSSKATKQQSPRMNVTRFRMTIGLVSSLEW